MEHIGMQDIGVYCTHGPPPLLGVFGPRTAVPRIDSSFVFGLRTPIMGARCIRPRTDPCTLPVQDYPPRGQLYEM